MGNLDVNKNNLKSLNSEKLVKSPKPSISKLSK